MCQSLDISVTVSDSGEHWIIFLGLFSSLASYCMAALPGQATGEKRVGTGMCRVLLGMKQPLPLCLPILQSSNGPAEYDAT